MKIPLAIGIAGFLGAAARYGIGLALPTVMGEDGFLPWSTLLINLSGSFALGWLTGLLFRRGGPTWLTEAAGTGFLGAYTTFSAFSAQMMQLLGDRSYGAAGLYFAASAAGGWLLAAVGLRLGRRGTA